MPAIKLPPPKAFEDRETEVLVLEFVVNDVIDAIGEEVLRSRQNSVEVDYEEVEWAIDQAIEDHMETAETELKIPDGKEEKFKELVYDALFGPSDYKQGQVITMKKELIHGYEVFFSSDKDVFGPAGVLVASKIIGRLVKVKNVTSGLPTDAYYMDHWFSNGITVIDKKEEKMEAKQIEELKGTQHLFSNSIIQMYEEQMGTNLIDTVFIGQKLTHKASGVSYIVAKINNQDNTVEFHGYENIGNWHPISEFTVKTAEVWTKDYATVYLGDHLEVVIAEADTVMAAFGWPSQKDKFNSAYYKFRSALVQSKFSVEVIGKGGYCYVKAIEGPLAEILEGDFIFKTLGDHFVKNRTKFYEQMRDLGVQTRNEIGFANEDSKRKKKTEKAELEEKQLAEDKAAGPYKMNKFLGKLVKMNWPEWHNHGEYGKVTKVDNETGRVTVKFNEGKTYEEYFFRKSVGEDKYLNIVSGLVFTDEA